MSFTFLRIPLLGSWQKTCASIANTIQKVGFCTEETFKWQDFDPSGGENNGLLNFPVAATNGYAITLAKLLKLGNIVFVNFRFTCTPSAPVVGSIQFKIPYTVPETQNGAFYESNGQQLGLWSANQGTSTVNLFRVGIANWPATFTVVGVTLFLLVE